MTLHLETKYQMGTDLEALLKGMVIQVPYGCKITKRTVREDGEASASLQENKANE